MILVMMACAIRNDDMTGWLMAWARLMAQNVWSFQPLLLFLCICAPLQLVGCSVSHIALYILCDFVHTLHLITEGCDSRKVSLMRCQYFETANTLRRWWNTRPSSWCFNGKCMELSGGTFPVLTLDMDWEMRLELDNQKVYKDLDYHFISAPKSVDKTHWYLVQAPSES